MGSRKPGTRRRSQRPRQVRAKVRGRDAKQIGQPTNLALRKTTREQLGRDRRQQTRELDAQALARAVIGGREHPSVVMNHVETEFIQSLIDESNHEVQERIARDQRAARGRTRPVDPAGNRARIVVHAPVGEDQEGHLRELVEITAPVVALHPVASLRPGDGVCGGDVLDTAPVPREPAVADIGPLEHRSDFEGEGRELDAP